MSSFIHEFLEFACDRQVLRFGEFKTKAGRLSPYFFNSGLFNTGNDLIKLGKFYAEAIIQADIEFDVLFGPAYKGIPLVTATAMALAEKHVNVPIAFNRKEAKNHGEKGTVIGGSLNGRVLLVDDVISAGTSINESQNIIAKNGGSLAGVCIALDRMERGSGNLSAREEVEVRFGTVVFSIANLNSLIEYLSIDPLNESKLKSLQDYKNTYGVN